MLQGLTVAIFSYHRHFSRSHVVASDVRPTSLDTFTEEEEMLRESGTSAHLTRAQANNPR